jgi:hypothetical protein
MKNINCLRCGKELLPKQNKNKFCSHSCSAIVGNTGNLKMPRYDCKYCGKVTRKEFCSRTCLGAYNILSSGEYTHHPLTTRKYLEIFKGWICSICGNTEWLGKPIPLVMDHRDGNSENWSVENMRFVCGNCDMQLPTYKGRNKGNGRFKRSQRYRDGLSH